MSSLESISNKSKGNTFNDEISSHKYNLFQQFFVIGLDPKISYNLYKIDIKQLPNELLSPKIISKFPNSPLPYINIPDSFVASHCFPKGLLDKIIHYKDEELSEKSKKEEEWVFSLDNLSEQDLGSSLRTNKLYYNCLLFYEKIENFKNLSNYRRKMSFKSDEVLEEEKNKNILLPKVICLSSFTPQFMNSGQILNLIKKYCDNYNFESLFDKDNFYPVENIIEGLIYNLPGLPRGNFTIKLDYGSFLGEDVMAKLNRRMSETSNKANTNKKLEMIFQDSPINKSPRALINYSLLMTFFTVEEIFDIIRNIILEEPILFFSDDIFNLTHTIEGIIALIYPLIYPYPVVSVLPEENFSLINVFYHFIFGINYKYSEELWKEKFDYLGDKQKIVIIPIETRFPNFLNDIDKEKNINSIIITKTSNKQLPLVQLTTLSIYKNYFKKEPTEKNTEQNKKSVKLPIHYSSKCIKRLEPLILTKMKEERNKKGRDLSPNEKDKICNKEIIDNFLYFFTCILLNYQEFIKIKYEKVKTPLQSSLDLSFDKDNMYKRPEEIESKFLNDELKINDMFNTLGFINNTPALDRPFYEKFFKTQIFFNFIKKKLFPISILDKLDILFFDDKINEKLSRESKFSKIETKFLDDKSNTVHGEISIESMKKEVTDETKEFLENPHNCERGLNYFQYIIKDTNIAKSESPIRHMSSEEENNQERISNNTANEKNLANFKFYYFVFPKLLNDGIFFLNKKKEKKEDNKYIKYNSSCFYSVFEKEAIKIVYNPQMSINYKNYSYSLNPISADIPSYIKYENNINKLWLQLFAKTFYCIPNNKKLSYFNQIIQFLKDNEKTIDDNTFILLFKTFNKYGDKYMNQEFFLNFTKKIKTYTSFLFLKEKVKKINNYIDYRSCTEKNEAIENKFLFVVNSFCTKVEEDKENQNLYNVCGEQTIQDISSMFNEKDKFIRFECNKELNKIPIKQALIISCFYTKKEGLRYQINFRLISPAFILKQNWFKNTDNLNIDFLRKEYLECYLSAIFYFHQLGLSFDFLLPNTIQKRELFIENIIKDINIIKTEKKVEDKKEEEKNSEDKKEEQMNLIQEIRTQKLDLRENLFMSTNLGVDLGGRDIEFGSSPEEVKKKSRSPKKSPAKKKGTKNIKCAEFKLSIEEAK